MKDYNCLEEGERYFDTSIVDKKISVGILDISRDIFNDWVSKRTFDMTYWSVNQCYTKNLCDYCGYNTSVKQLLESADSQGSEIAIILAQGIMAERLYKIIDHVNKYSKNNQNFFVIGHIMAKEGRYPGLHRQMLVVNIPVWRKLGSPEFDEKGIFWDRKQTLHNFKVSEDKMSAEYTPAFVEAAEGYSTYNFLEDGANWVSIACENNIKIDNFNYDIRDCKVFLYPYSDTDLLEHCWKNLDDVDSIDKLSNYSQRAWLRKMSYQNQVEKDRVYAYNTERLSGEGIRSPGRVDVFFGAAAGFKTMKLLENNGFHENTVVHYFDWCNASLDFKKHLLETWNGKDFHKWLLEHDLEYNFSSTYRGNYEKFWRSEIDKEFNNSEDEFYELWQRYSKLKHHFHVIDIVNEPEKLFDIVNKYDGNKVIWTTNIWASMQLHWNVEIETIRQKFERFASLMPSDLICYGQDWRARDLTVLKNNMDINYSLWKDNNASKNY